MKDQFEDWIPVVGVFSSVDSISSNPIKQKKKGLKSTHALGITQIFNYHGTATQQNLKKNIHASCPFYII